MAIFAPRATLSPLQDRWKPRRECTASSVPLLTKHRQETSHKSASWSLLGEEEAAAALSLHVPVQLPGTSSANLKKAEFREEVYGFMQ